MKLTQNFKRILSVLLVFVLVFSMMPVTALAATTGRENDTIFFATDLHQLPTKLTSLLKGLAYEPGLVVLGGDYVDGTNSSSLLTLSDKIHSVYPNAQTFYTYGKNDANVAEEGVNAYAFARTGEYYSGQDYYVYAVDHADVSTAANAAAASSQFLTWANSVDPTKVIFVMSHMPIHQRRGDNLGGAVWMNALNQVGQSHDVVFLWGHNHDGETSTDTSVFFVANGGSLTPEGGSTGTINFTYVNPGYIARGYGSMVLINDDNVTFARCHTTGSVSTNTIERKFVGHIHKWELTEKKDATCGENGSNTYTCECGESYTEKIYATGKHTNVVTTVDPTCTEKGSTTITCTTCGKSDSVEIDALGHDLTTSELGNYLIYTCQRCGVPQDMVQITKPEHQLCLDEENSTPPTCTEDGIAHYVCSDEGCEVTKDEVLPALGHTFQTVTKRATCAEEGLETYTCTTCGYSESETLPVQEHVFLTVTVEGTCTKEGSVTTTCANCNFYNVQVLPATGHTKEIATFAATCARDGAIVATCADCGESDTEVIPATGHNYKTSTVEATCTAIGYTVHTCTICGDYYNSDKVEALGHSYSSVVTAPTCTTAGFTTNTCSTCGDSTVTDKVAALGHNYTGVIDDGSMIYTCSNCNDSYTEEITDGYTYAKATKFTTSGQFVITLYSNKTYYALSHKDNQITAVPVTVENSEITSPVTEDMLWKYSSKKLYYKDDAGQSHYLTASGSTLGINTSGAASISYSSNKLKVGTKYLRFSSNAVSLSSSSTTTYLYKQAN